MYGRIFLLLYRSIFQSRFHLQKDPWEKDLDSLLLIQNWLRCSIPFLNTYVGGGYVSIYFRYTGRMAECRCRVPRTVYQSRESSSRGGARGLFLLCSSGSSSSQKTRNCDSIESVVENVEKKWRCDQIVEKGQSWVRIRKLGFIIILPQPSNFPMKSNRRVSKTV